jgi:hypothetical protein
MKTARLACARRRRPKLAHVTTSLERLNLARQVGGYVESLCGVVAYIKPGTPRMKKGTSVVCPVCAELRKGTS